MKNLTPPVHAPLSRMRLRTDTTPWYRQFWPWFLIALPATSVIFSIATLVVAINHADSLVRDDWYDAGVTINRDFHREAAAAARGLLATLRVDAGGGLRVELEGAGVADVTQLQLRMSWPSGASRDQLVDLVATAPGRFVPRAAVRDLTGRWDVAVLPADDSWRIAGRVELARNRHHTLDASR